MNFEARVTLGEVIQILTFLGALFLAYNKLTNRLTSIEVTMEPIVTWWQHCIEGKCPHVKTGDVKRELNRLEHMVQNLYVYAHKRVHQIANIAQIHLDKLELEDIELEKSNTN